MSALYHTLPTPLSGFIGRARELASLAQLLGSARLITLTGPGGMGKTRLALEMAVQQQHAFEHGACFVNLAPLSSPASMAPAIAEALSLALFAGGEPQAQLLSYLCDKQLLLLLDNFEHLLTTANPAAGPMLVSALLAAA